MDHRIRAATVQAIAHYAGRPLKLTRRWQVERQAIRENMNPVEYLAALAPLLHLELDEKERRLTTIQAEDPWVIVDGEMAEHVEIRSFESG